MKHYYQQPDEKVSHTFSLHGTAATDSMHFTCHCHVNLLTCFKTMVQDGTKPSHKIYKKGANRQMTEVKLGEDQQNLTWKHDLVKIEESIQGHFDNA